MKSFIIAAISLFAATAFAQPAPATVTLQLANDFTGANIGKVIPADGSRHQISEFFAGSPVDSNGDILASSAQLTAFPTHVQCAIFKDKLITVLTPERTYADLDGDSSKLSTVSLSGAYIECNGSY
jgi:hypothetical protein